MDPTFAATHGGRWNPPDGFDALSLNADVLTARDQIQRLLEGSPVTENDLDDDAPFLLVLARLPGRQSAADAVTDAGLTAMGLPATYPLTKRGRAVTRSTCQTLGRAVRESGLRGVWCRSAARRDGAGRELTWFPARPSSRARWAGDGPLPYGAWRHAESWEDLGLPPQKDPA